MKQIPLTQAKFALVDDEDYDRVMAGKSWHAYKKKSEEWDTFYAKATVLGGKHRQSTIRMHRFIMGITDSNVHIDHIDHNGLNNQKSNLRLATTQQNQFNKRSRAHTSKYKGVHKLGSRFRARIKVGTKQVHLGVFQNERDAAISYNAAARVVHGEFAHLNEV